jgi:subtilisin family serine protease
LWASYGIYVPGSEGDHGTPVAGPINAADNLVGTVGVAPNVALRVQKVSDLGVVYWDLAAGAISNEDAFAHVMNMSFSTKIGSPDPPPELAPLYDAIKVAYYQHGVVFVASTGNQSSGTTYSYPARYPEVIGVGATDENDLWTLNNWAPGNVDITAPGTDIYTVCKGGGTANATGTSFSTPQAAGAVMLLRAIHPTWTPSEVWEQLRTTAVDVGAPGRDEKTGWGRIDIYAALQPPPPFEVYADAPGLVTVKKTYPLTGSASHPASNWQWDRSYEGGPWEYWSSNQNSQFVAYGGTYTLD